MRIFWVFLLLFSGVAFAAPEGGRASLVADEGRAAVRIELEPGWKTYWRMPGETGVAPRFDWSASENLKSAGVLFPAPTRFIDSEGETIGFADGVVFPVVIEALDAARPVKLRLKLDYGLCRDICIPATADLAVDAGHADPAAGAMMDAATALLPQRLALGAAQIAAAPDGLRLRLPGIDGIRDVFVEGAPLAYFRAPRADGSENTILPVDGMEDVTLLKGTSLTLTVTAGSSAYEIPAIVE